MSGQSRQRWERFRGRASGNGQVYQAGGHIIINAALAQPPAGGPEGRLWNVAGAVATFTARDLELAAVTTALGDNPGVSVVLHGMPGVGKTQLALAWVYAHAGSAKVVWQIRAANRLEVVANLAQLADRLGVAAGDDLEQAAQAAVLELNGRDDWLLLFDDATPDSVAGLVPVRGGRVLVTSRNPNLGSDRGVAGGGAVRPACRRGVPRPQRR